MRRPGSAKRPRQCVERRLQPARSQTIEHITTVVIGAGHAGLATSRCLTERSIDHVVLERGEVANSWRRERWDSLRLLTPNWQSRLPGYRYEGVDPDGFMTMAEVIEFVSRFAAVAEAPVRTQTTVTSVTQTGRGYHVATDRGDLQCRCLVLASGACNLPNVPALQQAVPDVHRALHADGLSQSRPIARWRRARCGRLGHRCAVGRMRFTNPVVP